MRLWADIQKAVELLKKGDVVGLPTETVYGLAGAYNSSDAIEKIFKVKARPSFDPLIVHIGRKTDVLKLASRWSPTEALLAEFFWPGPLTIVTEKNSKVSDRITAGLNSVGIRMPQHPVALRILRSLGTPLAAPSANKFGKTSPTKASHVASEFQEEQVFVVDGGESDVGIESTVLMVNEDSSRIVLNILRPGLITASDLKDKLSSRIKKEIIIQTRDSAAAPGNTESHYQPKIPLVIIPRTPSQDHVTSIEKKFGIKALSRYSELLLNSDPRLAARDLYSKMREVSGSGSKWMFVRKTSDRQGELWSSLWNRLEKASSLTID